MRKIKTNGICTHCKNEVRKDSQSILTHLSKCEVNDYSSKSKTDKYMILLIEGKYAPQYWLVIKAKPDIALKKIDIFIKNIWVECCGHLSSFSDKYSEISMNQRLNQVFEEGLKIDYIYDFGSSTEISLSFIQEIEDIDDKEIQILFRNKANEYKCSYCNNKAVSICPFCIDEAEGLLCESCIGKHKCVQEEGEDVLSPLVNSPREGVCGYTGYSEKEVKKYFPKEVI